MNSEIENLLINNGATLVGFANIEGSYNPADINPPLSEDSQTEFFEIPQYPKGIAIAISIPQSVIRGINMIHTFH